MKQIHRLITIGATVAFLVSSVNNSSGQSLEQGKGILQTITQQYPDTQPVVWGLATSDPFIALVLPQEEWRQLSSTDQVSLALYVRSLIPVFRANPKKYVDTSLTAASYRVRYARVANLCEDCWLLGVGSLTINGKGALLDKVVVQGDALWDKASPPYKGMKASEFCGKAENIRSNEGTPDIANLLRLAEQQTAARRLSVPPGNNALETYRQILQLMPDNQEAIVGIQKIKAQYKQWITVAKEKGKWIKVRGYCEKVLAIDPHDSEVLKVLHEIEEHAVENDQQ